MMGKRFFLTATLASLLASVGCLRNMCEKHGYYPVQPPACQPQCCTPCVCQPATGAYVPPAAAPAPSWTTPVAASAPCPAGCVPANH